MKSAKTLLDDIVDIIEGDLGTISDPKLDVRTAAKITRYSHALIEILAYDREQKKEEKKRLSSLTTEEIHALAKNVLKEEK